MEKPVRICENILLQLMVLHQGPENAPSGAARPSDVLSRGRAPGGSSAHACQHRHAGFIYLFSVIMGRSRQATHGALTVKIQNQLRIGSKQSQLMNNKLTRDCYYVKTFQIPREHSQKHDNVSSGKSAATSKKNKKKQQHPWRVSKLTSIHLQAVISGLCIQKSQLYF